MITGSGLVASAEKWSLDYLEEHIVCRNCDVIISRNHNFKYFDFNKVTPDELADFKPSTKRVNMKISDFAKRIRDWKKGDPR